MEYGRDEGEGRESKGERSELLNTALVNGWYYVTPINPMSVPAL